MLTCYELECLESESFKQVLACVFRNDQLRRLRLYLKETSSTSESFSYKVRTNGKEEHAPMLLKKPTGILSRS